MALSKKNIHKHGLRAMSYGLVFSFILSSVFGIVALIGSTASADELIEQAFAPAKAQESIINLGNTKDAVGNEILRAGVDTTDGFGVGCMVKGQHISEGDLTIQMKDVGFLGTPEKFCVDILGGDEDTSVLTTRAPLIVRITKFLLRITIVLSITMVLYSGVMYIVEASKGAEVKETTTNLMYIIGGVLLALMSLALINLISSLSVSSLGIS